MNTERKFIIDSEAEGKRIDIYLSEILGDFSRAHIQKNIEKGNVLINSKTCKSNYKLKFGDQLIFFLSSPTELDVQAEKIELDVAYEDQDVILINKPAGMVVHPAAGNNSGTLVNAVLGYSKDLSGINGVLRPGIVHRIDKYTSGLLIVAKNDVAHQSLAVQFKNHSVERNYLALVHGTINEPGGIIDAPIGRHHSERKKMAVTLKNSKKAVTHFRVKERFQNYTLIDCKLETGRTHQIRVHLSYIKHPVVGDQVYGYSKNNLGFNGQALHAYKLGFIQPRTGEKIVREVDLPQKFQDALALLRREMKDGTD